MREIDRLNTELYRLLKDDYPQDIFEQVKCLSTDLGNGDTFFSVEQIAITINRYYGQCKKIAPKLQRKTLKQTCEAIHHFLYWHFQYKADGELQKLRSPACSWHQRKEGIDCKSYTILAGSILKMLGYNFYIRQVKQLLSNIPDEYSHVYVVVPIDQKNNDLTKGYYVIDGTVPTMDELPYIIPSDYLMMKHYGLNGRRNYLVGLSIPQIGGNYNIGNPNAPSSPAFQGSNSWKGMDWTGKTNTVLGLLSNVVQIYGGFEAAKRGLNQSGQTFIPQGINSENEFKQWLSSQQNTANNEQNMLAMVLAMQQLSKNQSEPKKTDYTPFLIGGGILFAGVIAVVLLKDDKK